MNLQGLSIIGARRGAPSGKTFAGIDPTGAEPLPVEYHSASEAEVETAARLAQEAFPVYAQWPGAKRVALMNRIAELLETNAEFLIERANLETALEPERLHGELERTCFQLRFYSEAAAGGLCAGARIDHADPARKPLPKPDLRSMRRPLGPVVVFGASNFPFAYSVAGGDTASALAVGCPVIVKAHPAHPGVSEITGLLVRQAAADSGAPEGVFSMLFDVGFEIGAALVRHPLVKAVGFTGSRRGGRVLMDLAAARPEPIPVYAEMSSVNPVFILPGALRRGAEELAERLHASVTLGVGQFCTNPGLVFVENGAAKFLAKLAELMADTPPGTMLTAGIRDAYGKGIEEFSKTAGVKRLVLVEADPRKTEAGPALFTADADTFLAHPGLMHEVFGPSTLVVQCSSRAKLLAIARRLEGQLTASLHATPEELEANGELPGILAAKAGRLIYNGFPTGVEVTHAMTHGGPHPATAEGRSTSVGTRALERFLRPVTYQDFPDAALPPELQEANPLGIARLVDGKLVR